ncbi:MAG: copper chaperone PCu(A)C [Pseudomonadota bacterium]
MTGAKRAVGVALLAALVVGAWYLLRPNPAAHLLLTQARAAAHGSHVMVTMQVENAGRPDQLLAVTSPEGDAALVVQNEEGPLTIPAGGTPTLSMDGAHIALMLPQVPEPGQLIPITLTFDRAGKVTTQALVGTPDETGVDHAEMGVEEIPDGEPVPEIALHITPNEDGYTLAIDTKNFTFNEDMADGPHVPEVGHGHLYLNGLKLSRLYRDGARIGALPRGTYHVEVVLNTNDHRVYTHNGAPIAATAEISVP